MDKNAHALVLEMLDLLLAGYRPDFSTADKKKRLNEVVEKLVAHDSDPLVRDILHALIGADLSPELNDKLRQKY